MLDSEVRRRIPGLLRVVLDLDGHATHKRRAYEDVLEAMRLMISAFPIGHGVRAFIELYCMVTEAVHEAAKGRKWKSGEQFENFDVLFAQRFFEPLALWCENGSSDRSWDLFFDAADREHEIGDGRISYVQFAFAGVCLHILNGDLTVAAWAANNGKAPIRHGLFAEDYDAVDVILGEVEVQAMREMATGVLHQWSRAISPLDRDITMVLISGWRKVAWTNIVVYDAIHRYSGEHTALKFEKLMDVSAALVARIILTPTAPLADL
jgi:hypothetical protein